MMIMIIREGTQKDVEKCAKIAFDVWKDPVEKMTEYFKRKLRNKEFFVAVINNKVVAFMTYNRKYWNDVNFLDEITVVKEHRRKGIATSLIKKLIEISKKEGARRLFGSTDSENIKSIKMHLKNDFKECGYINNMFLEGKKELIFSLKL